MKPSVMEVGGGHPGIKRQLSGSSSRGQSTSSRSGSSSQYSPALFEAVRGGKVDAALSIIAGGADPNSTDPGDGRSVLQVAVEGGTDIWLVKELLRLGASANKPHLVTGQTCLHVAARRGYQVCVRALLNASAEVDARDNSGQTALMAALQAGHSLVAQELLGAGCDVNAANSHGETALHAAARGGHLSTAEELVNYGADTTLADDRNQTAFYLACKGEHVELASLLVRQGSCDVNVQESQTGRTPLHWAVEQGNGDMVRMLVQRGANLNVADKDWYTPFLLALDRGHKDFVTYMLATNRCDVSVMNRFSYTALHMAARDGHVDLVDQFVAQQQDVNVKGPYGSTPLIVAAFEGRVDVVSRLFEHGAIVTLTDRFRATALIHAILSPKPDEVANRIVSRLIRANVDVNLGATLSGLMGTIDTTRWRITTHLDTRMYTPLDVALMAQRYTIIAMLVKRGCEVPATFRKQLEHRYVTANLQSETRDSVNTIRHILGQIKSVRSLKELSRIAVFDSVRGQEPASVFKTKICDKKVLQYLRFLDVDSIAWNMSPTAPQLHHLDQKLSPVETARANHNVVTNGYHSNVHQELTISALASPSPVSTTSNSSSSPFVRNVSARKTYHMGQKSPNGIPRLSSNYGFSPNNNSGTKSPTTKQQNGFSIYSPPKTPTSTNQNLTIARPANNLTNGNKTSPTSLTNHKRSNGINQHQEIFAYKPGKTSPGISPRVTTPSPSTNGRPSRSRNDSESSQIKGYKKFDNELHVYTMSSNNSPSSSVASDINKMTDRNNSRNNKTTPTSQKSPNYNSNSHSNGKSNGLLHVGSNGVKHAYAPSNSNPIGGNLHITIGGTNGYDSYRQGSNYLLSPANVNGEGKWSPASPLSPLSPVSPVSPADRSGASRSRLPQPMRKQQLSPSSVTITNDNGGLKSPAEEIDYFGEDYY